MPELVIESPTHGKHKILIDDQDWDEASKHKWYLHRGYTHNTLYARTNTGKYHTLHRLVLKAPKGSMIDHINGNGLDNRRENLRFCTKQQNQANQKQNKGNSSGYKGVAEASNCSKWRAYIRHNYKQIHLGNHNTPEEAARAYDAKAKELYGEFARLNFPEEKL